jgi:hypothetical protein
MVGFCLLLGGFTQQQTQPRLDKSSLVESYLQLKEKVIQAIRDRGGDPENQQVHWVFGFSTGHFAADPSAAEAARYLASKIVEDLAKVGDQVSAYAWEMEVWDHLSGGTRTVTIDAKTPEYAEKVHNLWPRTPRAGSVGGHDTERAIVEIVRDIENRIGNTQNVCMILITPTAASVAASGTKVWGQDHPEYQEILKDWHRVIDPSLSGASRGASIQVPYRVVKLSGVTVRRTLDVVLVVPRQFVGTPVQPPTPPTPNEELPRNTSPDSNVNAIKNQKNGSILIVFLLTTLIVLAFLSYLFVINPMFLPISVTINKDQQYVIRRGEGIVLTGDDSAPIPERWRRVVLRGAPAKELGRIQKDKAGIRITAENCNMRVEDMTRNEYTLRVGEQARVEFYGEEQTLGSPPKQWKVLVEIEVERVQG